MEQTKVEMRLEEEFKPYKDICEKLTKHLESHLAKGLESADTEEVGLVVDMIKDLCEAKEKIAKCCYYKSIVIAMEEEKEMMDDEDRMYYRGRSATTGRYVHRDGRRSYHDMMMPYDMRDMDRYDHGRMYYTDGGSGNASHGGSQGNTSNSSNSSMGYSDGMRGYSEGYNHGQSTGYTKGYEDGRRYKDGESNHTHQIENSISELSDDIMELKSREEKDMAKQKLQRLLSQIQ